jgi:hypothetical protein
MQFLALHRSYSQPTQEWVRPCFAQIEGRSMDNTIDALTKGYGLPFALKV